MSTVEQIESALERLSFEELRSVRHWLDDFIEDKSDVKDELKAKNDQAKQEMMSASVSGNLLTGWTEELEARFRELSRKEALVTISVQEREELEHLAMARRQFVNPRTPEEIEHEKKQSESLKRLLSALNEYIAIQEAKMRCA